MNFRLTDRAIRIIRECKGTVSARDLADRFGVSLTTIKAIWRSAQEAA